MKNASEKWQEASKNFLREFLIKEIINSSDFDKLNEEYNTLRSEFSDVWVDIPITINVPVQVYLDQGKLNYEWEDVDDIIQSTLDKNFNSELKNQDSELKNQDIKIKSFRAKFDAVVKKISKKQGIKLDKSILDDVYYDFLNY
jgi:hypothetical protein